MEPLHRDEAIERSRLLRVTGYDVELDLTRGDETYGSVSRVRFESTTPGASTFLNFKPARDASVRLNGQELPADAFTDGRVRLDGLEAENELVATGEMGYSHTGEGMHRFVDPADGEAYMWAETGLYYGGLVYGQFDQPDLKAPLRLSVTAPDGWTVVANAAGERGADGTWRFVETPPISTYLMTVVAGPYHEAHAQHGEIPLGLYVRRSLAEHLDADELFEVTRGCFDYYHRTFGIPYPFGKYDQAFVPELFLGAMENPGCVKFTDQFIYRSRVTDDERALRAFVVAHEMAHMWFGNLVTMRWWDDLWLNESFAEYIGHDATDRGTRFTSAWTYFSSTTKSWGYRQDELPSSHPVSTEVLDTDMALLNLDGISYAKGAGTLKQLVAWVGRDAFLSGLRDYFGRHAWANTTLTDLLDALEPVSGRDLHAWSREWLQRPGVNVLRPEITADGDRYERVAVLQSAPPERPTLRSHRVGIGLYHRDGERLVRRERVEVDISGARTEVPELAGTAVPDLLLLNDDDLTWAKIRLDDRSLATLRDGGLIRLADSLPRALLWSALWDMARDAELPVGQYLDVVLSSVGAETDLTLVRDALRRGVQAIDELGRVEHREARLAALAARARELMADAEPGSDRQLAFARALASIAIDPSDVAAVRGWLEGRGVPDGLSIDPELRWLIVRRLAVLGEVDEAFIGAEQERDGTSLGAESAAGARASLPSAAAKERAWRAVVEEGDHSSAILRATTEGFWHPEHLAVTAAYVEPYFAALPDLWERRGIETAWGITMTLFPRLLVSPETIARVDAAIAADTEDARRRVLVEGRADLERWLRTREADVVST